MATTTQPDVSEAEKYFWESLPPELRRMVCDYVSNTCLPSLCLNTPGRLHRSCRRSCEQVIILEVYQDTALLLFLCNDVLTYAAIVAPIRHLPSASRGTPQ
jgi:hypothetical protein